MGDKLGERSINRSRPEPTLNDLFGGEPDESAANWVQTDTMQQEERLFLHRVAEQMFASDYDDQPDQLIGHTVTLANGHRYHLDAILGMGGQGVAFEATSETGDSVVVKITPAFNRTAMYPRKDPTPHERVKAAEARRPILEAAALHAASKLGLNNPGPRLYDAMLVPRPGQPDVRVGVLVMERLPGKPLDELIQRKELTADQQLEIARQLAFAIGTLHEHRIVHGDIKPANLLVDVKGNDVRLKVADFGIVNLRDRRARQLQPNAEHLPSDSRRVDYALAITNPYSGSYASVAEHVTEARDAYSYGRTLQHLLYGAAFHDFEAMGELYHKLQPVQQALSKIADELVRREDKRLTISEVIARLESLSEPALAAK